VRLVLVLGDQLTHGLSALCAADRARDVVVMAEVSEETAYVPHHPQKIALVLSAMRHFAAELRARGWQVAYSRLEDPANSGSIVGELDRHARAFGAHSTLATEPGEWRLLRRLSEAGARLLPDDRFLCSREAFAAWAEGRRQLRMEHFYRWMRRRTGLLMQADAPAGGRWNFDAENRKPARADLFRPPPLRTAPDAETEEVLYLVERRFAGNFGRLRPFGWAVDRAGALAALEHFIQHHLPGFGDTQDAMLSGDRFLNHAVIAPYLNIGLLTPQEACDRAEAAWRAGRVPINAAEGFIRQILGWREFIRGVYFLQGPGYVDRNVLGHDRPLPAAYWGGPTRMNCVAQSVAQTREEAYAHHIQRLMVTGNFALLAGVDPAALHRWYLSVYADAFEWVEAPNTLGMSQFADGGVVASKPYVSSGAYIDRMSDYCGGCHYRVADRSGPRACPFNPLYWQFLHRHRARFQGNPRMAPIYRTWDRMAAEHRVAVLDTAGDILARLDAGEPV